MTFIIAEIGSNFSSLEGALQSIQYAQVCGASAAKFQLFSHKELYGIDGPELPGQLPREWVPILKNKADGAGIELMCTAFSAEGLNYVDQFVSRHKIASSNLTDPLLLIAAAKTRKPVLLSVGASGLADIDQALAILREHGAGPVTLLYCVAAYPATEHNLFVIETLRQRFGTDVGYSDHTLDKIYAPLSAVKHFGATVIEKHVNLVHVESGPDVPHSLGREDFKSLCDVLKGKVPADWATPMEREEKDFLLKHNVRCIATAPIPAGSELKLGQNFGAYRSLKPEAKGIVGFCAIGLNGKTTKCAISAGDGLCADNVNV